MWPLDFTAFLLWFAQLAFAYMMLLTPHKLDVMQSESWSHSLQLDLLSLKILGENCHLFDIFSKWIGFFSESNHNQETEVPLILHLDFWTDPDLCSVRTPGRFDHVSFLVLCPISSLRRFHTHILGTRACHKYSSWARSCYQSGPVAPRSKQTTSGWDFIDTGWFLLRAWFPSYCGTK